MQVVGHQHIGGRIQFQGATVSRCGVSQFVDIARAVDGLEEAEAAVVAALHEVLRYAGQVDACLSWHGVGRLDPMPMLDLNARLRDQPMDGPGVGESLRLGHHSRHSNRHTEASHSLRAA